ncbi:hypothetical protein NFX46_18525 [Streptomyces phaeoluteigriseus]|uniref:Uncharacterized protein n=1 Tax=Streptomyces phaeoluteigriseus TaxID=114686 RepID=A0ABY4Z9F7_9ACTN|nr:hypothetical protein [Streptomyces phaeoluteigriseus]USQ85591.1 hypothetical protein NFX46_18525 [Streptomyces phaeoluteigriseus]
MTGPARPHRPYAAGRSWLRRAIRPAPPQLPAAEMVRGASARRPPAGRSVDRMGARCPPVAAVAVAALRGTGQDGDDAQ